MAKIAASYLIHSYAVMPDTGTSLQMINYPAKWAWSGTQGYPLYIFAADEAVHCSCTSNFVHRL